MRPGPRAPAADGGPHCGRRASRRVNDNPVATLPVGRPSLLAPVRLLARGPPVSWGALRRRALCGGLGRATCGDVRVAAVLELRHLRRRASRPLGRVDGGTCEQKRAVCARRSSPAALSLRLVCPDLGKRGLVNGSGLRLPSRDAQSARFCSQHTPETHLGSPGRGRCPEGRDPDWSYAPMVACPRWASRALGILAARLVGCSGPRWQPFSHLRRRARCGRLETAPPAPPRFSPKLRTNPRICLAAQVSLG